MKLLLDVGNSRVKWAFDEAGIFVAQGHALRDDDAGLGALLEFGGTPDEIRIANVAGVVAGASIAASLREHFQVTPVFACSSATGAGVRNGYTESGQLGVDRWLGICAAYTRYGGPVCVVDAGTATTIDIVMGAGEHLGGLILPGMDLMQRALLRDTGNLARLTESTAGRVDRQLLAEQGLDPVAHPILLGRDTAAAIRNGALLATASVVRACMDRYPANFPGPQTPDVLVITGGAGPALLNELHRAGAPPGHGPPPGFSIESRPNLVLEGLALDPPCYSASR